MNTQKALKWLCAKEIAAEFGVRETTVRRWREEGTIPEDYVRFRGKQRLEFRSDVVELLATSFKGKHQE